VLKTEHRCIIGDSRKMPEVDNSSIHLVVTSPPYWQLKDYGEKNQIGFDDSYEEYINNLNLVWAECYRVLHPGCRMIINIGDQFARAVYYGRYKIVPIRTEIIKFCESIGFDYMGAIIWQKKTTMNTTGGATVMGSYPFPRNGIVEIDYEFILILKKPGTPPKVSKEIKEKSRIPKDKWKEYFLGHWYFNGAKQDKHIAVFPVELPKRAIEMFTFKGETVLDPFLGSGTTTVAGLITERNTVGYEVNSKFTNIIKDKIHNNSLKLLDNYELKIINQKPFNGDWNNDINKHHYIFKETVKFDKKIDPNKLKFGSKISISDENSNHKREEYFWVKEIISPNLIILKNGLKVRLLGVKPINKEREKAIEFLSNKMLNRYIYLKYDEIKFDNSEMLLAYVYLKNKTFINAHLIKQGFCSIDEDYSFKYKAKFSSYLKNRHYEKTN